MKLLAIVCAGALCAPLFVNAPAATPAAAAVQAGNYEIDGVHSFVVFRINHLGVSYTHGRFNAISGKIAFDPAKPEASSISVEVKTDSVDTADEGRDKHLKSPDFFNAAEFPTITFKSKSVKKVDGNKWRVEGELALHGVTKPLTCDVDYVGSGDRGARFGYKAGFETTFNIRREDFGMKTMLGETGIGNDVRLTVSLEANLKK